MEYHAVQNTQINAITVQQMRILIAVVNTKSCTKAAEKLGFTQPAISKTIAKLESRLGCPLLIRHSVGMEPTDAAKMLAREWETVLLRFDDSIRAVEELTDRGNRLRIGCFSPLNTNQSITEIIKSFAENYPQSEVILESYDLVELQEALLARELDLIFTYSFSIANDNIAVWHIHKNKTFLVGARSVFEDPASKGYRTLAIYSQRRSSPSEEIVRGDCASIGYEFEHIQYCDNQATLEFAVIQGHAAAICGEYMLEKDPSLMAFPIPAARVTNYISAAWIKGSSNKRLRQFVDNMRFSTQLNVNDENESD